MIDRLLNEPVLVSKFFEALVAALVAFNLPITDDQRNAILGLIAASIAVAAVVRSKVTPVRKLENGG